MKVNIMGADYMDVLRAELTEEVTTRAATALIWDLLALRPP